MSVILKIAADHGAVSNAWNYYLNLYWTTGSQLTRAQFIQLLEQACQCKCVFASDLPEDRYKSVIGLEFDNESELTYFLLRWA